MGIGSVVIMAFQMMLVGNTPVHEFGPSWPIVILGFATASVAMVASILPGLIDSALGVAIGISNLLTASFGYFRLASSGRRAVLMPPGSNRRVLIKVICVSAVTYALLIVFGVNLLIPHMIPREIILLVLLAAGLSLGWLSLLLDKIPKPPAKIGAD